MSDRPKIAIELGVPFYVCPLCSGQGIVAETRCEALGPNYVTTEAKRACTHCFGFGRVPLPSWFRDVIAAQGQP